MLFIFGRLRNSTQKPFKILLLINFVNPYGCHMQSLKCYMTAVIGMERDPDYKTLCIVIIPSLYICLSRGYNYKILPNYTPKMDILLFMFYVFSLEIL